MSAILDPIFNLLAGLLEWFYDQVPSFGFAIIALTTLVLVVLSPLTYRSTKSMVSMRRLQPQIKRLQKRHKNDRETLNAEMMALYQEHNVSPLSGCLPILIQSPVFIVMFRVIRGITRRASDIGFAAGGAGSRVGEVAAQGGGEFVPFDDTVVRNFNPEYLHREPGEESQLYLDLIQENEMNWLGIDLSRTPFEVVTSNIGQALPYVVMVIVVAFLGWFQQRQIQGRMTGEISSQQQMIMRIIPWMLPIFSVTMPAGLVLYFIVSALLRIGQQAYITRTVYQNEELTAPIEFDDADDDDDDDDDDEPENPLAALFGGGASGSKATAATATPSARHGSRRPTSSATTGKAKRNRPQPAKNGSSSKNTSSKNTAKSAKTGGSNNGMSKNGTSNNGESKDRASKKRGSAKKTSGTGEEKISGWGRAKRSAPQKNETPEKPVSRRVTPPKGDSDNRRGKK